MATASSLATSFCASAPVDAAVSHAPPAARRRRFAMNAEPAPAALDALAADYEIIRELGHGGTAVVYLARERASGAGVAIKLVRAPFAGDDEATARLAREARFIAQLHHPNVVPVREVLDLGDAGVALVMVHVSGRTLRQILRDEGALAPDRAARMLRDVAAALGAAHELGIVHRDVKPENVFVDDDDRAVLADFGIARSMSPEAQALTMHGVSIGTPAYMAPEQIDGDGLDARADLYSLGLLGWEMLTGRRPFAGEALYSVLYQQKHVQLDDPRALRADLPAALLTALAGSVEKERDARWADAAAFLEALDGASEPRDWPVSSTAAGRTGWRATSRRRVAMGSGIAALAALALVIGAVRIHSRSPGDEHPSRRATGSSSSRGAESPPASTVEHEPLPAAAAVSAAPQSIAPQSIAPQPVAPPVTSAATGIRVVAGGRHSCLLAADGRAFCWGGNDRGQLGTSSTTRLTAPGAAVSDERFTALASGMSHSCGLTRTGDAYCWGDNDAGQLGDGSTVSHAAPVRVAGQHDFRAIAAGSDFACALDTNTTAWCWGSDASGQLGDRAGGSQRVPVPVAGGRRFAALATGWSFACALDRDGRAWCWGSDASGELGDSANVNRQLPVRVRGGHRFTAIAAGSAHACGVATDGSAWCWGSDANGQLGDAVDSGDSSTPVRVRSGRRFASIAAGAVHSCALTVDGDAWCWGSNVYGQLGNDSNSNSALPVRVAGGHAFVTLRAFGSHNCGVTSAGETFCWGYNLDGQLGDGTRTHRSRPVYVQRPAMHCRRGSRAPCAWPRSFRAPRSRSAPHHENRCCTTSPSSPRARRVRHSPHRSPPARRIGARRRSLRSAASSPPSSATAPQHGTSSARPLPSIRRTPTSPISWHAPKRAPAVRRPQQRPTVASSRSHRMPPRRTSHARASRSSCSRNARRTLRAPRPRSRVVLPRTGAVSSTAPTSASALHSPSPPTGRRRSTTAASFAAHSAGAPMPRATSRTTCAWSPQRPIAPRCHRGSPSCGSHRARRRARWCSAS
jgi:alpha-tubulin suppressor-like RCC1 family protein/serine/threonine protein kinase